MKEMKLFDDKSLLSGYKRDFFYKLQDFIVSNINVLFLLGPRKCGKTVALKQLQQCYDNICYIDFKINSEFSTNAIIESIKENEDIVYLLDEITYLEYADRFLCDIAYVLCGLQNCKTKIIVTGSQAVAIRAWGLRAFSATAQYLQVSFINYKEWLDYNKATVSEESYVDFCLNSYKFTKLLSIEEYLNSCLDETVISNSNSLNIVFNNDCEGLTSDILLAIMYTTMFTLHNHVSVATYKDSGLLTKSIRYWLGNIGLSEKIISRYLSYYSSLKGLPFDVFKRGILFLLSSDLITITYVSSGVTDQIDIIAALKDKKQTLIHNVEEFFLKFNVCVKHPMFYLCILQLLTSDIHLDGTLLGSITECYVRGLLNKVSYEYHDLDDNEIDYVDYHTLTAIEFSISNKKLSKTMIASLDDTWDKYLLTKDYSETKNGVNRIPYYQFIYNLCKKQ